MRTAAEVNLTEETMKFLTEQIGTETGEKKGVKLDDVTFQGKENMLILYKLFKASEELWAKREDWLQTFGAEKGKTPGHPFANEYLKIDYREVSRNYLDVVPPITAEEIVQIENAEIKRICIKYFGWEKLLSFFKHEIVDSQVIERDNLRWDDKLLQHVDRIKDKYELINIEYPLKDNSGVERVINFQVVRCWCTTTGREYILNAVPPSVLRREGIDTQSTTEKYSNAVEALCSLWRTDVKEEAIKHWYRHGDVPISILKEEYELTSDSWKCKPRVLTVDEYMNKLVCQA